MTGLDAEVERFRRQRLRTFYPKTDTDLPDDLLRSRPGSTGPDAGVVADLCRRALGVGVTSAAPLDDQGTFHHLTRVVLADGRRVVVRVNAVGGVRDLGLGVDAWAQRRLRDRGLPSVPVHRVDVTREEFPFDYAILGEAEGSELAAYHGDGPRLRRLLGALGGLLARVHQTPVGGFGWVDIDPRAADPASTPGRGVFTSWRDYLLTNLDAHLDACAGIGAVTAAGRRRIASAFAGADGLLGGVAPALLHGDLSGRNVFTDGESVTALIDWEDCLAGDPVFDLAFWATFHPEDHHPALLDGYAAVRPLPGDFAARFWLYYLRVALSKTVQRHRFGYPDRMPGRPPASHRIGLAVARLDGLPRPAASR